jgi:hypothetical protein
VTSDCGSRLLIKRRLTAVPHQHGIECRRVQRRRNPASNNGEPDVGVGRQRDVGGERHSDEHRGMRQHSRGPMAGAVVASVTAKERVARVARHSFLRVIERDSARVAAVTGLTGASVPAERLFLEEVPSHGEMRADVAAAGNTQGHTTRQERDSDGSPLSGCCCDHGRLP